MDGKELKKRLLSEGFKLAELAVLIGISEAHMYSKMKAKNLSVETVKLIAKATNKSVFYWLNEPEEIVKSEYKDKYYALLEKYNKCLEEKDGLKSIHRKVDIDAELKNKHEDVK